MAVSKTQLKSDVADRPQLGERQIGRGCRWVAGSPLAFALRTAAGGAQRGGGQAGAAPVVPQYFELARSLVEDDIEGPDGRWGCHFK